jgi:hypothetical protein
MKRNLWNMTAATLGALALSMNGIRPASADTSFTAAGTVPPTNFTTAVAGLTGQYMGLQPGTVNGAQGLSNTLEKLNLGDWQLVLDGNRPLVGLTISNQKFPLGVTAGGSNAGKQSNITFAASLGTIGTGGTEIKVSTTGTDTGTGTQRPISQANHTDSSMTATISAKDDDGDAVNMLEGDYSMSIVFNVTAQ